MDNSRHPIRRIIAILVGLAISTGFLILLFSKSDFSAVARESKRANIGYLAASLITMLIGLLMMSARLLVLMRPLHKFHFFRVFKTVLLGLAGNNVLPFRMGELLRVDYLARHGNCPHSSCLATIAVERLLDLFCLVLIFFMLLPIVGVQLPSTYVVTIIGTIVISGIFILVAIGKNPDGFSRIVNKMTTWAGEKVSKLFSDKAAIFAEGLKSLSSFSSATVAFLFSVGYWMCSILTMRIVLGAFDIQTPWYGPGVVIVFIAFGVALPSSPAFVGTYHYFAALALITMKVAPALATSFAIIAHATGVIPFTLISIVFLMPEILRGELFRRRQTPT